jgi:hypothetical protein
MSPQGQALRVGIAVRKATNRWATSNTLREPNGSFHTSGEDAEELMHPRAESGQEIKVVGKSCQKETTARL